MCDKEYLEKQHARVQKLYTKAKHKGFANKLDLADWYVGQLKQFNCRCYFCETSILDINKLIEEGLLKTRAVRGKGKRGPVLEIDKNDKFYSKDLCVLACYYCNNDKSYTTSAKDYKQFFGEARRKYFDYLMMQVEK